MYEYLKRHNGAAPGPGSVGGGDGGGGVGGGGGGGSAGAGDTAAAGPATAGLPGGEGEGLRHRRLGGAGPTAGIVPLERVDGRALLKVYRQGGSSWVASSSAPKSLAVLLMVVLFMYLFSKKYRYPELYM